MSFWLRVHGPGAEPGEGLSFFRWHWVFDVVGFRDYGTQFTCFSGTEGTHKSTNTDAARRITDIRGRIRHNLVTTQFTCFTGTKVKILTLRAASQTYEGAYDIIYPVQDSSGSYTWIFFQEQYFESQYLYSCISKASKVGHLSNTVQDSSGVVYVNIFPGTRRNSFTTAFSNHLLLLYYTCIVVPVKIRQGRMCGYFYRNNTKFNLLW